MCGFIFTFDANLKSLNELNKKVPGLVLLLHGSQPPSLATIDAMMASGLFVLSSRNWLTDCEEIYKFNDFLKMGQTWPLFVYFRPSLITTQGFEPRTVRRKMQMNQCRPKNLDNLSHASFSFIFGYFLKNSILTKNQVSSARIRTQNLVIMSFLHQVTYRSGLLSQKNKIFA